MNKPLIVIDHRERGEVREAFLTLSCRIQLEQLEVADYVVSPDFAIERKRGDDLASSLCDNRFFSQVKKLKKHYGKVAVILEKPRLAFKRKGLYEGSLLGAMVYCAFKEGVPIIPTQNETQTAQVIYSFAKREQSTTKSPFAFAPVEVEQKRVTQNDQIRLLEGLWKVGKTKAQTLLNHFGSPWAVANGIRDTEIIKTSGGKVKGITGPLNEIKGFGPSFATTNKRLLEIPFRASKLLPVEHVSK